MDASEVAGFPTGERMGHESPAMADRMRSGCILPQNRGVAKDCLPMCLVCTRLQESNLQWTKLAWFGALNRPTG